MRKGCCFLFLCYFFCILRANQNIYMEIETVGENAGKVWRNLNENRGEISIQELSRKINLSAEDVALAVGWLARENNIFIQRHNYLLYVSHDAF